MAKKAPAKSPVITLADIVSATLDKDVGFLYTSPAVHTELAAQNPPLVEVNPQMANEAGELATRASAAGIAQINGTAQMNQETAPVEETVETSTPVKAAKVFEIEDVPIPQKTRQVGNSSNLSAGRKPVYPFEQLELGKSFFVPNSNFDKDGKVGDAFKSLGSVIASANARYAEEVPGETRVNRKGKTVPVTRQTREFDFVRDEKVTNEGVIKGVRVYRQM